MEAGIYRLTKTINNPKGDKRCGPKYWRRPEWKEGDRFLILPYEDPGKPMCRTPTGKMILEPLAGDRPQVMIGGRLDEVSFLILPHLELLPESLESILAVTGWSARTVLADLLQMNYITLDDVKRTIQKRKEMVWEKNERACPACKVPFIDKSSSCSWCKHTK